MPEAATTFDVRELTERTRAIDIKGDITAGKHPDITGGWSYYESEDTRAHGFGCVREEKLQYLIDKLDEAGMLEAKVEPCDVYLDVAWRN